MSTQEEQEQIAVAIQQLNARLQQQETAVTILTQERESLAQHDRHARTAREGRSGLHTGDLASQTSSTEIR